MPPVGFEPTISAGERPQTYALDRADTGTGGTLTVATIKIISFPSTGAGRDSSVGIATLYGLDGPGIESQCRRDFSHPSKRAQGPTQPPIQSVPGLSRE